MKKLLIVCFGVVFLSLLAGCQSKEQQVISTVQAYLQALVKKDEASFVKLSCPDWQSQALLEYDAFGNVTTTLKDLSCKASNVTANSAIVNCTGSIEASYQNEVQSFPLSDRNFKIINSGGDWQVCGY